jgi:hypothetical protein
MWTTCPRSSSSGYHAEFHEGCYQKHTNPLNCRTISSDISGYYANFHEGHCTVGECEGRGMGTAWTRHSMRELSFKKCANSQADTYCDIKFFNSQADTYCDIKFFKHHTLVRPRTVSRNLSLNLSIFKTHFNLKQGNKSCNCPEISALDCPGST